MIQLKNDKYPYDYRPLRYRIKQELPSDVHLMNKNESKLLRKLKKQTGLTEPELRGIKKYRVMLSDAQKIGTKSKTSIYEKRRRYYNSMKRSIAVKLNLPVWHSDVDTKFKIDLDYKKRSGYTPTYIRYDF